MIKLKQIERKDFTYYINRFGGLICFCISVLSAYVVFWLLGETANGEKSVLFGDLILIYIPAIKNLCRDIMSGESIYYSWNTSFGMNTSLHNAYYAYNPFNILYLIFYNCDDNITTMFIILIKVGLSSFCFHSYMRKSHNASSIWNVVFAVFYSMCAFQVACNFTNIIWLDALWILPLTFRYADVLFDNGKYLKLILVYTYIFTTEFYMGYIIGVISFLYFTLRLVIEYRQKDMMKLIVKYIVSVIFAVGLSAWTWIPTLCFLKYNNPVDATGFEDFKASATLIYRAFFCREISTVYVQCPNIYCGTVTFIFTIFFFIKGRIENKQKLIYLGLFVFAILSCFITPLYKFWHGFDNPDGWTYRFAYIISFLMCSMSVLCIEKLERKDIKICIAVTLISLIAYVADVIYTLGKDGRYNIAVNTIFLIIWLLTIMLSLYDNNKLRPIIYIALLVLTVSEIAFQYRDQDALVSDKDKKSYALSDLTEKETVEKLKEDTGLYRVNYLNELGFNSGTYYGYNGISHFSTAENPYVRMTLSKLGIAGSTRLVLDQGLTDSTKMLFDIKYDVIGAVYRKDMTWEETYSKITENEYVLGIGYMVCGKVSDYYLNSVNAFENNNQLLSIMTGKEINYFIPITEKRIRTVENGVKLSEKDGGYLIEAPPENERASDIYLDYYIDSDKEVYSYIYQQYPYFSQSGFLLAGGYENMRKYFGQLSLSYIKPLLYSAYGPVLRIIPLSDASSRTFDDIFFAEYDDSELKRAYDELKTNQLIVEEYHDGYIKGKVNATEDKNILFTSIPYDKGWKAYVNGEEREIYPILNNAFSAIVLSDPGENSIVLEFKAIGAKTGIIISIIFLIALIICYNSMRIKTLLKGGERIVQ